MVAIHSFIMDSTAAYLSFSGKPFSPYKIVSALSSVAAGM